MDRIYHPIDVWEEIGSNMWGRVDDRKDALNAAISITSNHDLYGKYMVDVVMEWRYSCENALTDKNLNKKAWIGHAAVAKAANIPEDITREAWGFLTNEQRILANNQAERAIKLWERNFLASKGISEDVGTEMLF